VLRLSRLYHGSLKPADDALAAATKPNNCQDPECQSDIETTETVLKEDLGERWLLAVLCLDFQDDVQKCEIDATFVTTRDTTYNQNFVASTQQNVASNTTFSDLVLLPTK